MAETRETSDAKQKRAIVIGSGVVISAMFLIAMCSSKPKAPETPQQRIVRLTCEGDVVCAGSRVQWRAEKACKPLIEGHAKYVPRWREDEDVLPLGKWSERYDVIKQYGEKRIIEFQGEAVEFQNGFGAWQQVAYECDYDPVEEEVIAARVDI